MREFDYIILGGGCAGLSLAYELDIHQKLNDKTLAIVEPRTEYKRDKTWSFWKVSSHNFDDCIKKSWKEFSIKTTSDSKIIKCDNFPYQSIDSGLFYKKINDSLAKNKNIKFFKDVKELKTDNAFVFNSVPSLQDKKSNLWQHFHGIEIETDKDFFNDNIVDLMDFDCDQRNSVHFFMFCLSFFHFLIVYIFVINTTNNENTTSCKCKSSLLIYFVGAKLFSLRKRYNILQFEYYENIDSVISNAEKIFNRNSKVFLKGSNSINLRKLSNHLIS